MKRTSLHKHIYRTRCNTWSIDKFLDGRNVHFKTCKTLDEAIRYRDRLVANGWKALPPEPEEVEEKATKEYYKYIEAGNNRYYRVRNKAGQYLGMTKSIEEALWFRDKYGLKAKDEVPHMKAVDLTTDNPYLKDGLKYPLPERLILPERNTKYGTGTIVRKGPTSFHIHHGKKGKGVNSYVCACPTYEMAWYVKREMSKVDWDKEKLQAIIDDYPKFYTKLLFLYQYIHDKEDRWAVVPPLKFNDGKLEHILYHNIEDALYERDFLKEHGWDYDLLAEIIDDSKNPYYDMELPPYPSRKIRNISERDYHEKELGLAYEWILEDNGVAMEEIAERLEVSPVTMRNWLKKFWGTDWPEFKRIALAGDNPLEILEKVEQIIQPDLSRKLPSNWNNWVSHLQRTDTYQVRKADVIYGTYKSEELAHKISNELQKVNWDKSKLKQIQAKFGYTSPMMSKRWVYAHGNNWAVRRKGSNKKMVTYGVWRDKRIAEIARDMYIQYGFDLKNSEWINETAEWIVQMNDLLPDTMFGRCTVEDIAYFEEECRIPYTVSKGNSGKVRVLKTINGKYEYFGTYSEDKAREVVEFLMDNNWDRELLEAMQEMGEI